MRREMKDMEKIANIIRNGYNIKIPIENIYEIVEKIGGRIIESDEMSEYSDAFIRKIDNESFEILVSSFQPQFRRNFTISCALGYLFIYMGFLTDTELWNKQDHRFFRRNNSYEEEIAEQFAKALLMPISKYKNIIDLYSSKEGKDYIVDVQKIAEFFNVSHNIARQRGQELGYLKYNFLFS